MPVSRTRNRVTPAERARRTRRLRNRKARIMRRYSGLVVFSPAQKRAVLYALLEHGIGETPLEFGR